jgi:predicted nucleic acid-binding protein
MKVLIDANVLLDFLLQRKPEETEPVFALNKTGKIQLYISTSIVHIAAYWLKKYHSAQNVKNILLALLNEVQVLDVPHTEIAKAISTAGSDIEDAIQYQVALYHIMHAIITNDKAFIKTSTPALWVGTPQQFLKLL